MKLAVLLSALALGGCAGAGAPRLGTASDPVKPGSQEAPAAFDGMSNGLVDEAAHLADLKAFEQVEEIADGLGPVYNAQSCRECHQNPQSGGNSQVTEVRVGHRDAQGRFEFPRVPIARGTAFITGRTLINDRAICPNQAFPDQEIQEHVGDGEIIRTLRISLGLFGDGFVEAVSDDVLRAIAARQCKQTEGRICGKIFEVPVLEAPGTYRVGRFGWKNQQASLLSFAGDAYRNEIGITNRLLPEEATTLCDTVPEPEDKPDAEGIADVDRFARFVRATKAPPRDAQLAATEEARRGSALFDSGGCATCHLHTLVTTPVGTKLNGGTFEVPPALGDKAFHPYGDFLMHDVGTGDGIVVAVLEHHGRSHLPMQPTLEPTANRIRTAPLWGLRTKTRFMHDGRSLTPRDAILRHGGEAEEARKWFERLSAKEKEDLLTFLRSL